ncbi:sensor histidine kinase [Streptomyces xinghaiensis]|uniref:sensor histidine kinase n=1 Tax=Streptomyces xinghaiensis TaxID=1038928 RepID=UPI000BAFCAF0|nr:histidine kinase [Streptomyces xinghaiensis]
MTTLAAGPGLARSQRWLRSHPLAVDAVLAGVLLVLVLVSLAVGHKPYGQPRFWERTPEPSSVVIAVLACSALILRRRMPARVLVCTGALTLLELVTGPGEKGTPVALTAAVALYTVGSRTDRSTTWRAGAVAVVALTTAAALFGPRPWYGQQNLALSAWMGMAAAAGDAVRSRRAFVDAIRERAERAERTREEEARRRVAEERMRIARELHDVVAHHIALVNVQAGVAAHVMDNRPDQAKEALAHVREASRSALNELRTTVGLLRQYGDPEAPTEPAPGLGVLDQLVGGFVRTGLPVEVEVSSTEPRGPWFSRRAEQAAAVTGELPAAVDLTAYRVVQEALTNTHKHAGEGAAALVRIARGAEVLEVSVLDDGAGAAAAAASGAAAPGSTVPGGRPGPQRGPDRGAPHGDPPDPAGGEPAASGPPGGHGLLGMRERVSALGGVCETGPRRGGGFRVHVRLPLTADGMAAADAAAEASADAACRVARRREGAL